MGGVRHHVRTLRRWPQLRSAYKKVEKSKVTVIYPIPGYSMRVNTCLIGECILYDKDALQFCFKNTKLDTSFPEILPTIHRRNNRGDQGRLVPQLLGWGPTMYWFSNFLSSGAH